MLLKTAENMNKPPRPTVVSADGTVLTPGFSNKTRARLEAEGRPCAPVPKHVEGGSNGHPVTGNKELIMTVRPDNHPNSRIILGVVHVPKEGHGGEAGIAVEELRKLREITKGFLGLRYDGAFTGMHIDAMMKSGVSTITPVPKSDRRRLFKNLTCKAGCKHTLYTEGGDFIELERLNT